MGLGPTELVIILTILPLLVLPIWGVVDAAMRPDSAWSAAGRSKVAWVVLQLVFWGPGAIVYFAAVRPKLKAAA